MCLILSGLLVPLLPTEKNPNPVWKSSSLLTCGSVAEERNDAVVFHHYLGVCAGPCGGSTGVCGRKSLFNEQHNGGCVIRAVRNLETGLLSVTCTLVRHCYGDVYSKTVVLQKT